MNCEWCKSVEATHTFHGTDSVCVDCFKEGYDIE